jgi:peptide deformylase|tara:strand:- start:57 stop:572 length:516 start_codon:yes stop_codon:yes gene_type:complete
MTLEQSQKHILKLNLEGNEVLRHNLPETDLTKDLEWDKIADLMHWTMIGANGLGLAANQVSVDIRMFVMHGFKTFINPRIIERSQEQQLNEEGCLSFPNLFLKLSRPKSIVLEYYNEKLEKQVDRFQDMWAQCITHEIDHLDGKLFIDYASKLKLDMARKRQSKANDPSRR